jgi:hypothetical protein
MTQHAASKDSTPYIDGLQRYGRFLHKMGDPYEKMIGSLVLLEPHTETMRRDRLRRWQRGGVSVWASLDSDDRSVTRTLSYRPVANTFGQLTMRADFTIGETTERFNYISRNGVSVMQPLVLTENELTAALPLALERADVLMHAIERGELAPAL